LLRQSTIHVVGRLVEASNASLYCELREGTDDAAGHAVYKPIGGERPLDDFPRGTLAYREVAAFEVSEEMGWRIVPPTVLRDGPFGTGMVQLWIDVDDDADVLEMILTRDARLRRMAVFDVLINNADRKGGHVLPTADGHLFGCDHGVCFSTEPKLRTVLWGWRGDPLSDDELACVRHVRRALDGRLGERLTSLLTGPEVAATARRADRLLAEARMPYPDPYRPAIPWPPF
jgi:hypothetical protein